MKKILALLTLAGAVFMDGESGAGAGRNGGAAGLAQLEGGIHVAIDEHLHLRFLKSRREKERMVRVVPKKMQVQKERKKKSKQLGQKL